jgi:hypothetical protein
VCEDISVIQKVLFVEQHWPHLLIADWITSCAGVQYLTSPELKPKRILSDAQYISSAQY